jgi:hypothetical protein
VSVPAQIVFPVGSVLSTSSFNTGHQAAHTTAVGVSISGLPSAIDQLEPQFVVTKM